MLSKDLINNLLTIRNKLRKEIRNKLISNNKRKRNLYQARVDLKKIGNKINVRINPRSKRNFTMFKLNKAIISQILSKINQILSKIRNHFRKVDINLINRDTVQIKPRMSHKMQDRRRILRKEDNLLEERSHLKNKAEDHINLKKGKKGTREDKKDLRNHSKVIIREKITRDSKRIEALNF